MKEQYFTVEYPLIVEKWQADVLDKKFEVARELYNELLSKTLKKHNEITKTKKYRELIASIERDENGISKKTKKNKDIWAKINSIYKDNNFTRYGFGSMMTDLYQRYNTSLDSLTANSIAANVWTAWEKVLFGNGKKVHFKKYGSVNVLQGQSNKSGIRYIDGNIKMNGRYVKPLVLRMKLDKRDSFKMTALECNTIRYCAIVRKWVKTKYHYYVQITFKGALPPKIDKNTGEVKHTIGEGDVGIDIGISTVAVVGENKVIFEELASRVKSIEAEERKILRKMDRSRRATNPDNFNEDGTIKRGVKLHWNFSNNYIKMRGKLRELYRKQAAVRKLEHEILANKIIEMGDNFYVEKMSFKDLAKRAEKTEKWANGRYKSKKRYGKNIGDRAPAMLLEIINRKLLSYEKELQKIDTASVKASQFNHKTGEYIEKPLSARWNNIEGDEVQRDLYSAFLIQNVSEDLKSVNVEKCNERYDSFLDLHDSLIEELSGKPHPSSMGF